MLLILTVLRLFVTKGLFLLPLIYAFYRYCYALAKRSSRREYVNLLEQPSFTLTLLLIGNFGLIILDRILFHKHSSHRLYYACGFVFVICLFFVVAFVIGLSVQLVN